MELKSKTKIEINSLLLIFVVISVLLTVGFVIARVFISRYDPSHWSTNIWDIGISLTTAYLVSYIFYLVVFIPDRRNRKSINKFIAIKFASFIREYEDFIYGRSKAKENDFLVVKQDDSCHTENNKIDLKTGQSIYMSYAECLIALLKTFNKAYKDTNFYFPFLDSRTRDLFYSIMESDLIKYVESFGEEVITDQTCNAAISELKSIKPMMVELKRIIAKYNENR
jgi:hypothetical protein